MYSTTHVVLQGHHLVALIFVVANISTALRLICYQPSKGARKRKWMAVFAYALTVCAMGQAIDTLTGRDVITAWETGTAVIVAFLVLRARGNAAEIARGAR